jgi:hypothetical protein
MPVAAVKKKPAGKAAISGPSSEPTSPEELTPTPTAGTTLKQSQTPTPPIIAPQAGAQAQASQMVSNAFGAPIQLTDDQFRLFLERIVSTDPNFAIPTSNFQSRRTRRKQGGDPDDSPSDSSAHGSSRGHRSRPRRSYGTPAQLEKRSPKHEGPEKLDDGTSPTYVAWKSLLRGKLRANADWWPTEQDRIDYVFSCTTGEAQRHLSPRIDEDSLEPWLSVDEILAHLDTIFRNHFEAEQAENSFYALKQQATQDFNDFHTEFARLASTGRVPLTTWRSHLWRKLNREFQNRLLATHHQHRTYQELARECQRLAVDLEEFHRQFPPVAQVQRRRITTDIAKTSGSALPLPPRILPVLRRSPGPFRALPVADRQDATNATTLAPDQSKATCFNCSKTGHFASSCPNPRVTPRIHEIEQENASGDEANDEDDADSESEN